MDNSALSKMQLHYWEAKQTFLKKVKRKEDDCVGASDAELDAKLELLKSIDETNQSLLNLLDLYQDRTCALAQEECIIGRFMRECGKVDPTQAGRLMSGSGKTLLFASHQFILLRNILIRVYRDVQTFQYRAVADTFDTVEQMEKARTAYRAALLWMKDLSKQLDPDAYNQMDKFKKVQNHVRKTKKTFEKLKIDTIQKIDLLSASRCNLFSNLLANYQNNLQNIWEKSSKVMNIFVDTFRSPQNYEFTMLKELNNQSSDEQFECFEARLKEILAQDNISEKDMLVFFEADYSDQRGGPAKKTAGKESHAPSSNETTRTVTQKEEHKKESKNSNVSSLLDLGLDTTETQLTEHKSASTELMDYLEKPSHFMPSSLIDLNHFRSMESEDLIQADFDQFRSSHKSEGTTKDSNPGNKTDKENSLQSWLNLFADIDPLSNPAEFDKFSSEKDHFDRNC